ncbi:hypothetical protein [Candidatus Poriferisodalis sp.]|uniref:hypothetical protein n=1 Tax=Candidatus Poriferisodalis sp. TaxID=3101277 RepID=UPI003B016C10
MDDSGTFLGLPDGDVFRLGLRTANCLVPYGGSHLGYSDEYVFFGRLRHDHQTAPWIAGSFVAPWGDAAYPLLTSPNQSWRLLRGSDYPLTMDRFSTEDHSSLDGKLSDRAQSLGEDVQPLVSLGFVAAGFDAGSEVVRFKNDAGEQHYLLSQGLDPLLEIDGTEAELLLRESEDVPSAEEDSEEGSGAGPTHSLRLDRVSDDYAVWSVGTLLWTGFCTLPWTAVQDVQTGSAVSCTSSVLLPVAIDSTSELRSVPPLRGLGDCTSTPWEPVLGTPSAEHDAPSPKTREEER